MILLLILQKIMPTTKVGVNTKNLKLMSMDLSEYKQDIAKTITAIQTLKTSIETESKRKYDDIELHLFNTCIKSTNSAFQEYAEGLMDDWETDAAGAPKNKSEIIHKLTLKWKNLFAVKFKDSKTAVLKSDDKAQYLALFTALTTTVKVLPEQVQSLQKSNGAGDNLSNANKNGKSKRDIAEWRKIKS